MSGIDLGAVERTMLVLAERSAVPFVYHDPANGQRHAVTPDTLASRVGYLPAIVAAGEAIWRQATGQGFELDIARDPDALLGYGLRGIRGGSFCLLMLAALEALSQVSGPEAVVVGELNAVWTAATAHMRREGARPGQMPKGPQP